MRAPLLLVAPMLLAARVALAGTPAVAPALPQTPPGASLVASYADGGQRVQVFPSTRTAPAGRRAIQLRYENGRTTEAQVGPNAIVQTTDVQRLARDTGLVVVKPLMPQEGLWLVHGRPGEDGVDVAARLATRVEAAEGLTQAVPDLFLARQLRADPRVPNDTYFPGQWFFDDLHMTQAWAYAWGDPSVTVAVIDTGCNRGHPDLEEKLLDGYDAVDDDNDPSIPANVQNEFGASHGTACAGLVGAVTDNEKGVSGACPGCTLRCVRLLPIPNDFVGLSSDVDAFRFVIDTGAAVASNSWGFQEYVRAPAPLATAIKSVLRNGRGGLGSVVVFAAGNENREVFNDEIEGIEGVLAVGVVTHYQEVTGYSNFGAPLDLVAPIGSVTTDLAGPAGDGNSDYTGSFGGTSSACPIVAGIAGLVASARPDMTGTEISDLLKATARQVPYATPDEDGHDPNYGFGLIDPTRAVKDALGIVDPPDAGPEPVDAGPDPLDGLSVTGGGFVSGGCGCAGGLPLPWLALFALALRRRQR